MKLSSKQFYFIAGALFVVTVAAIAGGGPDEASELSAVAAPASNVQEAKSEISQGTLERVRAELRKDPKVVDFHLDPAAAVTLQVAVRDDGTRRHGLAEYYCLALSEWGFDISDTVVRIVDASKVEASGGDFRSISLGTVQCRDQQRWD